MAKKKSNALTTVPVILILVAVAILSALFLVVLKRLNVLPSRYFLAVCIGLVVILLILFLLLVNFKPGFRCILGIILTLLYTAGLLYASFMLSRTASALETITQAPTIQVSDMSVYVRADDKASTLNDVASYTFGIMMEQDRDVTDKALDQLEDELSTSLILMGYDGPVALVKGLLNHEVDAILFNPLFFNLVSQNGGIENLNQQLRELTTLKVETVIETPLVPEAQDKPQFEEVETDDEILTIYINGVDATGNLTVGNGDVNIIATVNVTTHQIVLVSTPRDYYVPLSNSGRNDKLTHAAYYGIDVSMETLENLYSTNIDYYFRVNFQGFKDIIDAIGGITLVNDIAFTSDASQDFFYFPEGEISMNGDEALSYVRCRHAFMDGDLARGRHQMMVIKAVIRKMMSPDILSNFSGLLEAIEGNFITSIPYETMTSLVQDQLTSGFDWNIVQYSVSGYNDWQYCYTYGDDLSVVSPDYSTVEIAKDLMRQVKTGEVPTVPGQ